MGKRNLKLHAHIRHTHAHRSHECRKAVLSCAQTFFESEAKIWTRWTWILVAAPNPGSAPARLSCLLRACAHSGLPELQCERSESVSYDCRATSRHKLSTFKTFHVSRLTSHVPRLASHVTCLTSHVSRLTSHVSRLTSMSTWSRSPLTVRGTHASSRSGGSTSV